MPSPSSCIRCARPLAVESDSGLCPVCLASDTGRPPGTSQSPAPAAELPTAAFRPAPDPLSAEPNTFRPVEAPERHAETREPRTQPLIQEPPTATDLNAKPDGNFDLGRAIRPEAPPGYELIRKLGRGGMGDVYLARDIRADRLVAMKFLRAPNSPAAVQLFLNELQVLAKLDHPHIVRVIHHDFYRAVPFFTMEYVPGGTLSERLEASGPLDPTLAAQLIATLARAMSAPHGKKIVHRDLKPSNVLLAEDGTPKVSDFGLAKRTDADEGLTTQTGPLGTPAYMPPEQISSRYGEVSDPSDVYGLGATLYYLLTGQGPFRGDREDILAQVLGKEPERVRAIRPEVPLGLEAIVFKCLEKKPADRYATMEALASDLEKFLAGDSTTALPLTRWRRARRWAIRHRRRIAGACSAVVGAGLLVWLGILLARPTPPPTPPDPLEAINKELLAKRPVTLIGERGEPLWHDTPTGVIKFGENPTGTGGCYFPSNDLTILLLLDPPIDRYRVELELQHVKGTARAKLPNPSLGFFLNYAREQRPDGWTEQSFLSVGYNDLDRGQLAGPPVPAGVVVESYCFLTPPGRLPGAHPYPITDEKPLDAWKVFPSQWRKITADVSPDRLILTWHPTAEKTELLADLSLADIRGHRRRHDQVLKHTGPVLGHQFAPLPDWSPRLGLGVWAAGADIAVKNFVITPQ